MASSPAARHMETTLNNHPFISHPLISLLSACFSVILWLLSWVKALVSLATLTMPRLVYSALSYSMTLTLNFWSFALIFVAFAVALNYWIRFRYLNDYTQLKEPPLVKPDVKELHPDVNVNSDPPPTFHNYLDDFLQAVRVFGFLEKPVFHELARHLQTRRLIAGDSLSLDDDRSFYCVVDGMVQMYTQSSQAKEDQHQSWDDENHGGLQLLNEVGAGGTLSSLFTILSLFTENVQMSWQDALPSNDRLDGLASLQPLFDRRNSDISSFELDSNSRSRSKRGTSVTSSGSTVHADELVTSPGSTFRDSNLPISEDNGRGVDVTSTIIHPSSKQIRLGVIARATEDTTLAVIPAEAFKRLTKKFPKASGHIVQVILTRFFRVTFNAAHKYLGLTSEVIRTEKVINDIACHPLPAEFYEGGGLQHLRHRFDRNGMKGSSVKQMDEHSDLTSSTMVASPQPLVPQGVQQSESRQSDSSSTSLSHRAPSRAPSSISVTPRHQVQAGDLFSSAQYNPHEVRPLARSISILNTPRLSRKSDPDNRGSGLLSMTRSNRATTEDFDLKEEVMSCIAKSIGLLQPPLSGTDSLEASPHFRPEDSRRSPIPFNSSFGSLSLLDLGDDASSSITTSSIQATPESYMTGLDNEVEILFFPAGSVLTKAGDVNTGFFYVIEGFLDILLPPQNPKTNQEKDDRTSVPNESEPWRTPSNPAKETNSNPTFLFTVKPGGIAGYLASICHTASYVDIKAKTDVYVGFLPSQALDRLLEKRPIVLLTLAKRLISLLSPLILHIDASLDWMQVNAGQVLWRPQDSSDSFYIVINGRLRAITESSTGDVSILGEYGQGDTVGELDVITSSTRRNTLHAIRDTELIRMPRTLFNAISARNPQITAQILRMIASRVRDELGSSTVTQSRNPFELGHNNANLKTVAVLPVSRSVPIESFARKLQAALEGIGATTSYLNHASVSSHLGRHVFSRMGKLKMAGWLADQEQRYRTVLYVADSPVNASWTQTCIRQADFVMVVGMGDDPSLGEYERLLLSMKTTARKELVLLHPDRSVVPGTTREWLRNRPWIHQHIHVEIPGLVLPISKSTAVEKDSDAVAALRNLKERVQSGIQKYRGIAAKARPQRPARVNDFARLARRILGRSIGLVLGGGGARGISHLGLIRALEEYGIPIDHVAGTSIGAFIGGLYAREGDILYTSGKAKQFSGRMGNIWRILSDVTYPIVAYTTGHEFNRAIYKCFYGLHIEDMWLPFFCNTTNIIASQMQIHETGYAWRYIRASMSLVGLLPPICDNGQLLVDGGYVDNLPVATMFSMGASAVFACDVASVYDNTPRNIGDHVSGWWLLINRWNPFSNARNVPAITEIQSRLAYVSSVKTLEDAKSASGCLYIQMPVQEDKYGTLQFSKFEEIQKRGYATAITTLEKLEDEGRLPSPFIDGKTDLSAGKRKGRGVRRNSI